MTAGRKLDIHLRGGTDPLIIDKHDGEWLGVDTQDARFAGRGLRCGFNSRAGCGQSWF